MNNEQNGNTNAWKVLALALLVILAAMAGAFLVLRNDGASLPFLNTQTTEEADAGSSGKTDAAAENTQSAAESTEPAPEPDNKPAEAASAGTEQSAEPEAPAAEEKETFDIRITFADGFHHTRVEGTTAYIMEGHDNPAGDAIRILDSDKMGRVTTSLPAGEYTLVFGDKAYYDGMENITIGGENGPGGDFISDSDETYEFWKFLLPRQGENSLCLVLEWMGNDDLDLCVFNASAKRYISAIDPGDGVSCYLVEDDGSGSPGWEVVVIRDYKDSEVYTPFIRDGNNLMRGSLSAMEANGVRFSVLDHQGLLFSQAANPEERAALWMPCYIHKGKVIKESVYEYDPAKYAWAAYSKY